MERIGYYGSWTLNPAEFSNSYFITLINETWETFIVPSSNKTQYKAKGKGERKNPV